MADTLRMYLEVVAERDALKAAILDIDAHATALGEDADGFVTGGYVISIGSLHRALGLIGHPAPKCQDQLPCPRAASAEASVRTYGQHMGSCASYRDDTERCDCGFADALIAALAAPVAPPEGNE